MEKFYQIGEEERGGDINTEMTIPGSSIANVILSLINTKKISESVNMAISNQKD
ncbi:MAG: hypothetical protein IPI77_16305 [Saprospiraceae bacterium]|nr:hypothetical protein [Saprospiraceae bacterium]